MIVRFDTDALIAASRRNGGDSQSRVAGETSAGNDAAAKDARGVSEAEKIVLDVQRKIDGGGGDDHRARKEREEVMKDTEGERGPEMSIPASGPNRDRV